LLRLADHLLGIRAVAARDLSEREVELQEDRGDRRPDLVARHAEELGALTLEGAQLGDVLEHRDRGDDLAIATHRCCAHEYVQVLAARWVVDHHLFAAHVFTLECARDREVADVVSRAEKLIGHAVACDRAVATHDDDAFRELVEDVLELIALSRDSRGEVFHAFTTDDEIGHIRREMDDPVDRARRVPRRDDRAVEVAIDGRTGRQAGARW